MKTAARFLLGFGLGVASLVGMASGGSTPELPPPGPAGQAGKRVVFIASDFRNGGVMGAYRAFEEATRKLRWKVVLEDGQGQAPLQGALLHKSVSARPDGIVFGGFDPQDFMDEVAEARRRGIALVGWHAAKGPGSTDLLFANVSTRSADVARMAVDFVLQDARMRRRPVGVVIFSDDRFAVANAKTEAMRKGIAACGVEQGCRLLAVQNVPISEARAQMPAVVPALSAAHGAAWTYSLAVNDAYFDEINFPLIANGRNDMVNVSAGDGSGKALGRIGAGVSRQAATVAEPLALQGYQLADELNRAFAGVPPSGFQSTPVLVTTDRLKEGGQTESGRAVEAAYEAIWRGR